MTSTNNPRSIGQEFVSATVHLAGAVAVETGHLAHYTAQHIQARIGGVLIYFLDLAAVDAFANAVADTAADAPQMLGHPEPVALPAHLRHDGQEISLIVRLFGPQHTPKPHGETAKVSGDGAAYISCRVGGLLLVIRDAEAMRRLSHVADTVARLAAALWPHVAPADRVPEPHARSIRHPAR